MLEKLTAEQEEQRATWQYRCLQRLRSNETLPGAILLAVLDKSYRVHPPRVGREGEIDEAGQVWAGYQAADGTLYAQMQLCHIDDLIMAFRRLADDLKLGDKDRTAMFDLIRRWVARDARLHKSFAGEPIPQRLS